MKNPHIPPRKLATQRRGQQGFSLLEVVVLCSMMTAMAAVGVPSLSGAMRHYKLSMAANSVAQHLNACRQRAVAANRTTAIRISDALGQIDTNYNGVYGDAGTGGHPADIAPMALDLSGCTLVQSSSSIVRTFTGRGELPFGVAPATQTITVQYAGLSRTVSISPRGAVTVGAPF
jgi:type II secretory pathway pseudopilin PulG